MLTFLLLMTLGLVTAKRLDSVADQLPIYKKLTGKSIGILTTNAGAPVERNDTLSTLNTDLLSNERFINSMAHLFLERIPVRTVHPKGAGAFGYFKTTRDMSDICKAEFLNGVGTETPVAVRLSMGTTERGGSDLVAEPRGFSVKFYTTQGNMDIAGFNTPTFTVKDPTLFVPAAHATRVNPVNDFKDANMLWDFLSLHPEGLRTFFVAFSDQGIPDGYNNMPGHSIHTYPLYNEAGDITLGRFHFIPVNGTKYLNSTEAARLGAIDPNYSARSLYEAIYSGNYPTWTVYLQLLSNDALKNITFDPYDVSFDIPQKDFPWTEVGELVLDRCPDNYFEEVEQLAFCPGNLVPGIQASAGKNFEARRLFYRESQRYRLGVNFDKIPVNTPYRTTVLTYDRDGVAPVDGNGHGAPNYYPNSFNGPIPYVDENRPPIPTINEPEANNLEQTNEFYMQMDDGERTRFIDNIVSSLCVASDFVQNRTLQVFATVNSDLANLVSEALTANSCSS